MIWLPCQQDVISGWRRERYHQATRRNFMNYFTNFNIPIWHLSWGKSILSGARETWLNARVFVRYFRRGAPVHTQQLRLPHIRQGHRESRLVKVQSCNITIKDPLEVPNRSRPPALWYILLVLPLFMSPKPCKYSLIDSWCRSRIRKLSVYFTSSWMQACLLPDCHRLRCRLWIVFAAFVSLPPPYICPRRRRVGFLWPAKVLSKSAWQKKPAKNTKRSILEMGEEWRKWFQFEVVRAIVFRCRNLWFSVVVEDLVATWVVWGVKKARRTKHCCDATRMILRCEVCSVLHPHISFEPKALILKLGLLNRDKAVAWQRIVYLATWDLLASPGHNHNTVPNNRKTYNSAKKIINLFHNSCIKLISIQTTNMQTTGDFWLVVSWVRAVECCWRGWSKPLTPQPPNLPPFSRPPTLLLFTLSSLFSMQHSILPSKLQNTTFLFSRSAILALQYCPLQTTGSDTKSTFTASANQAITLHSSANNILLPNWIRLSISGLHS